MPRDVPRETSSTRSEGPDVRRAENLVTAKNLALNHILHYQELGKPNEPVNIHIVVPHGGKSPNPNKDLPPKDPADLVDDEDDLDDSDNHVDEIDIDDLRDEIEKDDDE